MKTLTQTEKIKKTAEAKETLLDFVDLLMATEKMFDMGLIQYTSEAAMMHFDLKFRKTDDTNLSDEIGYEIDDDFCGCTNDYFFEKINVKNIDRAKIKSLIDDLVVAY